MRHLARRAAASVVVLTTIVSLGCSADSNRALDIASDPASLVDTTFGPALAAAGRTLTDVSLVSRTVSGPTSHLAVYVTPTSMLSDDDYAAGMWSITALLAAELFALWPEVESFDVCQEAFDPPASSSDAGAEYRPTVTRVEMSRDQAAAIDWNDGSLADLLQPGAVLGYGVANEILDSDIFIAAQRQADG
jgi:hypothetical protein